MATYQVRFYKGDYSSRQAQANKDKCVAYLEHHFNSSASPTANYSLVVTGSNASETSQKWGCWYAEAVSKKFGLDLGGDEGILIGGAGGRGDGNIKYTNMPAILLEPLFISNHQGADIARSEAGQLDLALILVNSIRKFFPDGGLIGFSVGHKYKTSRPTDLGAAAYGGGNEADFAEKVLLKAKDLLENPNRIDQAEQARKADLAKQPPKRQMRVMQKGTVLWSHTFESSEELTWNPENKELKLKLILDEDDYMTVDNGVLTLTVVN
jgi:hypothetical protein